MPRISDLPLTTSVDEATALIAVSSNGTTYKITPANLLASSGVGVSFYDSDSSHLITLAGGSNLSANRTLTLTTGDADRTLNISAGDVTISSFAITILDDANAAAVRSTLGLGSMALETATDYLTVASAVSGYQPLDADLTTLAANITAFGHSLVDDADAAAARTTLGLGTAATANTGTSGANVPLLNANNTFGAQQIVSTSTSGASSVIVILSDDGAGAGPILNLRRYSASPAASDIIGQVLMQGYTSAAGLAQYASFNGQILNATSGSEDGSLQIATIVAGSSSSKLTVKGGVIVGTPTGDDKGIGTLNATTLYENGTSLAAKYQPLDSELTAIAGLTSAADRLPYFTGSGTASLATFTTAGRNLVDDADAAAQRTTLGLGTAATQNTGTSGTNVPLLSGTNTWSGAQTVTGTGSFFTAITAQSTNSDANAGPYIILNRSGGSPAASDLLGTFLWQGQNDALTTRNYAALTVALLDPTAGSDDSEFRVSTIAAGTTASGFRCAGGLYIGSPTGGDQGSGTLNASTIYENGTSLAAKYGALAAANVFAAAQTVRVDDASTNSVTVAATLSHTTTGTPATGIGVALNFEAETAAGNNEIGARIAAVTTDVTSTSEDFDLVFSAMAAGAAVAEKGRITSKGTYKYPSFTVAGLPAGTAGETAFASNGRKNGEGAGAGTGVLVFHDGTAWRACDTGATVAA